MSNSTLTTTDLLAAASEILVSSGYRRVAQDFGGDVWGANGRLFEDPYGIVAVVVYETWSALTGRWLDAQTVLVEVISNNLTRSEPKAWEGYLLLLTPAVLPSDGRADADRIRYDTARARKFLGTGEDLQTLSDVHRVLTPLLPLSDLEVGTQEATLSMLPEILSAKGVPTRAVDITVKAFLEQQPLLERLHTYRTGDAALGD